MTVAYMIVHLSDNDKEVTCIQEARGKRQEALGTLDMGVLIY